MQRKVKILEDLDVTGHRFLIKRKPGASTESKGKEEKGEAVVELFKELVPLLNEWMERRLGAILPHFMMEDRRIRN